MRKLSPQLSSFRARTRSAIAKFLTSEDVEKTEETIWEYEPERPKTRGDCLPGGKNEVRPCPWATCRHHLATLTSASGGVREVEGWMTDGGPTCALDMVDQHVHLTLEEVGKLWGMTRERVRQIEEMALRKLKWGGVDLAEHAGVERPKGQISKPRLLGPRGLDGQPIFAVRRRRA